MVEVATSTSRLADSVLAPPAFFQYCKTKVLVVLLHIYTRKLTCGLLRVAAKQLA